MIPALRQQKGQGKKCYRCQNKILVQNCFFGIMWRFPFLKDPPFLSTPGPWCHSPALCLKLSGWICMEKPFAYQTAVTWCSIISHWITGRCMLHWHASVHVPLTSNCPVVISETITCGCGDRHSHMSIAFVHTLMFTTSLWHTPFRSALFLTGCSLAANKGIRHASSWPWQHSLTSHLTIVPQIWTYHLITFGEGLDCLVKMQLS